MLKQFLLNDWVRFTLNFIFFIIAWIVLRSIKKVTNWSWRKSGIISILIAFVLTLVFIIIYHQIFLD